MEQLTRVSDLGNAFWEGEWTQVHPFTTTLHERVNSTQFNPYEDLNKISQLHTHANPGQLRSSNGLPGKAGCPGYYVNVYRSLFVDWLTWVHYLIRVDSQSVSCKQAFSAAARKLFVPPRWEKSWNLGTRMIQWWMRPIYVTVIVPRLPFKWLLRRRF